MAYLKTSYKTVKDYLFPVFCLSCEEEGEWVCDLCRRFLQISPQLFCPVCHVESKRGMVCTECVGSSELSSHIAMMKYVEDALVGKLLHVFKYQYAEDVSGVLHEIVQTFIQDQSGTFTDIDLIVPVPLHKKRFAERGFNQAASIANMLAIELDTPIASTMLIRSRHTPHQAQLKREERFKNVAQAFSLSKGASVEEKRILLVDDVYTTGATMQACAEVLKQAGARDVRGCSFARG